MTMSDTKTNWPSSLDDSELDELDAYYKAGIKPAEIADLIVKALGFTAIAIGVAQ